MKHSKKEVARHDQVGRVLSMGVPWAYFVASLHMQESLSPTDLATIKNKPAGSDITAYQRWRRLCLSQRIDVSPLGHTEAERLSDGLKSAQERVAALEAEVEALRRALHDAEEDRARLKALHLRE